MTRELSDVDAVLHLIFSGGPSQETAEELDDLETQIDEIDSSQRDERMQDLNQRPSIYVKVFEGASFCLFPLREAIDSLARHV